MEMINFKFINILAHITLVINKKQILSNEEYI